MSFNFCSLCPSVVMATIRPLLSNTNSTTTITFDFWLGVVVLIMKKKRPYIMEEHLSRQQSWAIWRGETRAWRSSWHIAWCCVPLLFTSRSASPSTAGPPQLNNQLSLSTLFFAPLCWHPRFCSPPVKLFWFAHIIVDKIINIHAAIVDHAHRGS